MCNPSPQPQRTRQSAGDRAGSQRRKPRRRPDDPAKKALTSSAIVVYDPDQRQRILSGGKPATKGIRRGDVREVYKVLPVVIGTGSFGTVRSCIHRESKTRLAIKSMSTKSKTVNPSLLKNEISLLQRINHRNVVKVVDVIQDREYIHIIMEQCRGADLFDITVDGKAQLGEKGIRRVVGSLLDAIAYLHERHIVHRDLKAEHLMFSSSDLKSPIKIIDFGVATTHKPGDAPMTAFAGSPRSMAPEVIKRCYGKECDLWSVGVITYFLLTRMMPFDTQSGNQQEVFQKIVNGAFYYPQWAAKGLSEESKDFIDRLLVVDPKRRLTAKQALTHPWIRGKKSRSKPQASPATTQQLVVRKSRSRRAY